jgi:hypothetical protein
VRLDEAAAHVGDKVIYRPYRPYRTLGYISGYPSGIEEGVITSVGRRYVFVRYGSDAGSKATAAEMLELLMSAPAVSGDTPEGER